MISVYLFCFVVGGFFVAASAFGGHHDADGDGIAGLLEGAHGPDQVAHALHLDMHTDVAHLPSGHVDGEHAVDLLQGDLVPAVRKTYRPANVLLSMRFWTFGSCFFGMTGGLLSLLTALGPIATLAVSTAMGLGCGGIAAWVVGTLRASEVSGHVTREDYIGALGTVMVPIAPGRSGKVRCSLRGHTEDLLAHASEKSELGEGTEVLVLGFEKDEAVVVHAGRLLTSKSRARGTREVT